MSLAIDGNRKATIGVSRLLPFPPIASIIPVIVSWDGLKNVGFCTSLLILGGPLPASSAFCCASVFNGTAASLPLEPASGKIQKDYWLLT